MEMDNEGVSVVPFVEPKIGENSKRVILVKLNQIVLVIVRMVSLVQTCSIPEITSIVT